MPMPRPVGYVEAASLNAKQEVLSGFEPERCRPLSGIDLLTGGTQHREGSKDDPASPEQGIRIRFLLKHAHFFSFSIDRQRLGRGRGVVASPQGDSEGHPLLPWPCSLFRHCRHAFNIRRTFAYCAGLFRASLRPWLWQDTRRIPPDFQHRKRWSSSKTSEAPRITNRRFARAPPPPSWQHGRSDYGKHGGNAGFPSRLSCPHKLLFLAVRSRRIFHRRCRSVFQNAPHMLEGNGVWVIESLGVSDDELQGLDRRAAFSAVAWPFVVASQLVPNRSLAQTACDLPCKASRTSTSPVSASHLGRGEYGSVQYGPHQSGVASYCPNSSTKPRASQRESRVHEASSMRLGICQWHQPRFVRPSRL